MTPEERALAAVIQERGYLVIRSWRKSLPPGFIVNRLGTTEEGKPTRVLTEQRMVIMRETSEEDYEAQRGVFERLHYVMRPPEIGDSFYRVTTD